MGGVDVGDSGSKKRATNSDINMIPFIDLLMVTISFLLITAVWVTNSRINADAQVPGQNGCAAGDCGSTDKTLHVNVGENDFRLIWKQEGSVVSEIHVPRNAVEVGEGNQRFVRYPELAKAIEKEWTSQGAHRDPSDRKADQAVLHSDDRLPFREIVAVLDALNAAQRDIKLPSGSLARMPAFNTTFAVR